MGIGDQVFMARISPWAHDEWENYEDDDWDGFDAKFKKLIEKAKAIKAKAGSEKVTLELGVLRQDGRPQRFDEDPDNSI